MNRNNKRSSKRNKSRASIVSSEAIAYNGPLSNTERLRASAQPPNLTSNLYIDKVFRFVLASSVTTEQTFTFFPSKLGALIGIATSTTNIVQLFNTVQVVSITLWSSINNQTTANIIPRSVDIIFSGSSLGIQGSGIDHNDMSVGQTRVAKLKVRPAPNSQAAQFQETVTTNTSQMFQLVAAGGAVCDLRMRATITHDARPTNNSVTVTGPAVVGNFYYLALDNNAGGTGSVGNVWVPPPSIITIT